MRLPQSYQETVRFTAFQLYVAYLALKNHFTKDSYDFHKYQGKVAVSQTSFETRRDRYSFEKLARHRDPLGMLVSNILHNPNVWIGSISGDAAAEQIYFVWKKRQESLAYSFKEELKSIGDVDDALFVEPNSQPKLMKLALRGAVSIEALCIIQACWNILPYWDAEVEPAGWSDLRMKMVKYAPFLEYDAFKMKQILESHQEEITTH